MCTLHNKIKDVAFSVFLLAVACAVAGMFLLTAISMNTTQIETLAQESQVKSMRKQIHFLQKTVADHRMEEH